MTWVVYVEPKPGMAIMVTSDLMWARIVGPVAESPKVIELEPPEEDT